MRTLQKTLNKSQSVLNLDLYLVQFFNEKYYGTRV
jgi:hypothetical protein